MDNFIPNDEVTTTNIEIKKEGSQPAVQFKMGRVLLWFAIGLLISGVVAFTFPDIMLAIAKASGASQVSLIWTYSIIMGLAAFTVIAMMIVINARQFKRKTKLTATCYIIYSIAFGLILSDALLMALSESLDQKAFIHTLALAFLVTAGCFLLMGILGFFFKKTVSVLVPISITLFIGALVISLVNFFTRADVLSWVVDFLLLGYIILITGVDMGRVKRIADAGGFDTNNSLAISCAATIYTDFILILIRFILIFASRSRNN